MIINIIVMPKGFGNIFYQARHYLKKTQLLSHQFAPAQKKSD
ncbi:Uncharacterised protein [Serratia fonticola]|uniref:Uncharacterized protein n=1 Tax=Serratia fonticola TaxID=47917 RepID=A0A4U9W4F6_SERFO|nr:Uncharacterised protein [Serratia fonticola]